ncbi:MAG TPA: hypothetical protein DCM28_23940 [Phycisphaerales bacterium]|nr:hypothetical protein [Phycisphaerales bacterium]HCD34947.1 hypothetical protein [Phycisphaerales bacterium]|tara:strand:- start:254 stop:1078 length:825 start_codon:yes stop_codon:yes gene_type:complete
MPDLSLDQLNTIKQFVFKNGRLLERQLFEYFFGSGSQEACLKALMAYQNADGGFGHGIEPDITCPASSGIGAETALWIMDVLDCYESQAAAALVSWIADNQTQAGDIPHPPKQMADYPHQTWWGNPDGQRILTLAGYLKKHGVEHESLYAKARNYFVQMPQPQGMQYYDYPYYVYLKYLGDSPAESQKLQAFQARIPDLLAEHADHFPLFSRAWYLFADMATDEILESEALRLVSTIQADGGMINPYPTLPHWRPIWTLDSLILLKQFGLISVV